MTSLLKYYFLDTNKSFFIIYSILQFLIFYGMSQIIPINTTDFSLYFSQLNQGPTHTKDFLFGIGWYFPFILCLYFISISINDDLTKRAEFIFLRITKIKWFLSRVIYVTVISFFIIIFKILLTFLVFLLDINTFIWTIGLTNLCYYFFILLLSFLSVFSLYFVLYMLFGTKTGFTVICTLLLIPWLITFNKLTMFIPGAFSILYNHAFIKKTIDLTDYTIYLATFVLVILLAGAFFIRQKDIIN